MKLNSKKKKNRIQKWKDEQTAVESFDQYDHLLAIKPDTGILFYSDYFRIDRFYCTIVSYSHRDQARDRFPAFWGCNLIPTGLDADTSCVLIQRTEPMSDDWVQVHQSRAEGIAVQNAEEQRRGGNSMTVQAADKSIADMEIIAQELNNGGSYLLHDIRMLIKTSSIAKLEKTLDHIRTAYLNDFSSITISPFDGCQYNEFRSLLKKQPLGHSWYFTSQELAGMYNVVTCGVEDPTGVHVGHMSGDVNNSAVLIDPDMFHHHAVVMNDEIMRDTRTYRADRWCFKASEVALLHGHRVVHFMLSDVNLKDLTIPMRDITNIIDMNKGDLNMFEFFGSVDEELSLFPMQLQKIALIVLEISDISDNEKTIIINNLSNVLTTFYTEQRMWYKDAKNNRDKLRLVGLPHNQYPKLAEFVMYLETAYKAAVNAPGGRDARQIEALHTLQMTISNLLQNNGDLFNTTTTKRFDKVGFAPRTLYDFRKLRLRGKGVAMAQFVNVLFSAIRTLGNGDMIVFHGVELLDERMRKYVTDCLSSFYQRGGKVIFSYNNIQSALNDKDFNHLDSADYTVAGRMTPALVTKYEQAISEELSPRLRQVLSTARPSMLYFRRGYTNVTFEDNMQLKPERKRR